MAAAHTRETIDQALASAREQLQPQLELVRSEIAQLAAQEQQLTAALNALQIDTTPTPPPVARSRGRRPPARSETTRKATTRSANPSRARRRRPASKPTAERLEQLRAALGDGPKSRRDLAATLKLSDERVRQLLGQLGDSVSSQPNGDKREKLWSIKANSNGAAAPTPKRGGRRSKRGSAGRPKPPKTSGAK